MKILNLKISNFKKIIDVDITPRGNVIEISGKNGAGKTSILDAFWCALGGTSHSPEKPIREGSASATIKIDLGDLTVERRYNAGGKSVLYVTNEVGVKIKSPQAVLDALLGRLSFDPLQFMRMKEKEQVTYLKELVGLDFTELDNARAIDYDKRTQAKRTIADLEAQYEAITVHEDTPAEMVDVNALINTLRETNDICDNVQKAVSRETDIHKEIDRFLVDIKAINGKIAALNTELDNIEEFTAKHDSEAAGRVIIETQDKLDNVETLNGYLRDKQARDALAERINKGRKIITGYDNSINLADQSKREQLSEANFPLAGLGFDVDTVTFDQVPISQASFAEQLKISTSMAMALNPELRVIRITDGSMLDSDSMQVIENIAEQNDFQVWVEVVDDSGEIGVFIRDGEVAAVNEKQKKESAA